MQKEISEQEEISEHHVRIHNISDVSRHPYEQLFVIRIRPIIVLNREHGETGNTEINVPFDTPHCTREGVTVWREKEDRGAWLIYLLVHLSRKGKVGQVARK